MFSIAIAIFAIQLDKQWEFWFLAVCVGMFQGAIQALSRSYFAKIIPAEKSGEYFGIYDICGKGASFLGTTIMGLATQLTGNANVGIGALSILFIVGLYFFIPIITVLRNAALNSLQYRHELELVRNQNIDIICGK